MKGSNLGLLCCRWILYPEALGSLTEGRYLHIIMAMYQTAAIIYSIQKKYWKRKYTGHLFNRIVFI